MSPEEIPWNAPSRYGGAGLFARKAVRRLARPVSIRLDTELVALKEEVRALHGEIEALRQSAGTQALALAQAREEMDHLGPSLETRDRLIDTCLLRDLEPGARVVRHRSGGRRAICSLAVGPHRRLLGRSALSFERYAERWGWDLVLSAEEDLAAGRPASWGKIPFVRSLLDEYDWVLWLDADVVIVDLETDISAEIEDDRDLYLVEHKLAGSYTANMGMFLLRSGAFGRRFLDAVWAQDAYINHRWWENAAALRLLGYSEMEPYRLVEPTEWFARTKLIDRRFNSVEIDRARRPVFVHHGRSDIDTRCRQITADLACTLDGANPVTSGRNWPARPIREPVDVRRRDELPLLLNACGLTGTGAEVGVWKGEFSEWLLDLWQGERLLVVDPWREVPRDEYRDMLNVDQDAQDAYYLQACRRLARFGERADVRRDTSSGVAATLPNGSLSFAYLDARHDRESVADDLRLWWPLIAVNGILAGHDYLDGERPQGVYGVRSAVDAFFGELGLAVHATVDDGAWPSWIVRKPG